MEKKGFRKVKYAELHRYYPIYFEMQDNEKLLDKILKSSVVYDQEYEDKLNDIFCTELQIICDSMGKNLEANNMSVKFSEPMQYTECRNQEVAKILLPNIFLYGDQSLKIEIRCDLFDYVNFRRKIIDNEYELSKKYYGDLYVNFHDRFFLLAAKITLLNKEEVWLLPEIIVFSNLMCFLKIEVSLPNILIDKFLLNNSNDYIEKIELLSKDKVEEFDDLETLVDYYKRELNDDIKIRNYQESFNNIILVDYEGMPNTLNKVSDKIKEDIYLILHAPVPNYEVYDYHKEAISYLKDHCNEHKEVNFYLKETGGCVSLVSKKLLNMYVPNNDITALEEKAKFMSVAKDINVNVEFAILINMMKKMNNKNYFYERLESGKDLSKLKRKHNENILYINQMSEYCFGSVIKQVKALEIMMPLYHNYDIVKEKSDAIDVIIEQGYIENKEKFQRYVSVYGIIAVILFGLPTINETMILIKSILETPDIPYVNTTHISFIIWGLSITYVSKKLIKE